MTRAPFQPHHPIDPAHPRRAGALAAPSRAGTGNAWRTSLRAPTWALLVPLLLAACGDDPGAGDAPTATGPTEAQAERPRDRWGIPLDAPVDQEARDAIGHLILQFRPMDESLTSDHHDRQLFEQRARFERLVAQGEPIGNAALQAYTGASEEPYLVRRALLWVGGRAAPENARDLLVTLTTTYGFPIDDRTEAALVLAETSPEVFLAVTRGWLERRERKRETYPDDEFLVAGWVTACQATGQSPVPMLADVATNLHLDPTARWLAVERMAEFDPEPLGLRALETCLVESSGDGYLRRKSAQSLRTLLPRESACSLMLEVLQREVDLNFREFLRDMIQDNCRDVLLDADLGPEPGLEEQLDGRRRSADGGADGDPTADGDGGR